MSEQTNPYSPPSAELLPTQAVATSYFVVGERKFWIMALATFGLYPIYWWYRHWVALRDHARWRCWPVPRALFPIFFAHGFARRLAQVMPASERELGGKLSRHATVFVVASIASYFPSLSQNPLAFLGVVVLLVASFAPLAMLQRAANIVAGDPKGAANADLRGANYVAVALGALMWLLMLFPLLVPMEASTF